jgi:hypothetical protein
MTMTIETSGVLTLQDIASEFGGSGVLHLGDYYRGGSFVSVDTAAAAAAYTTAPLAITSGQQIPESGPLQLSMFYGASAVPVAPTITYPNSGETMQSSWGTVVGMSSPAATIQFVADGTVTYALGATNSGPTTWCTPQGVVDGQLVGNYQYIQITSLDNTDGWDTNCSSGWNSLSTSRYFSGIGVLDTDAGGGVYNVTIEIGDSSMTVVATYTLYIVSNFDGT